MALTTMNITMAAYQELHERRGVGGETHGYLLTDSLISSDHR